MRRADQADTKIFAPAKVHEAVATHKMPLFAKQLELATEADWGKLEKDETFKSCLLCNPKHEYKEAFFQALTKHAGIERARLFFRNLPGNQEVQHTLTVLDYALAYKRDELLLAMLRDVYDQMAKDKATFDLLFRLFLPEGCDGLYACLLVYFHREGMALQQRAREGRGQSNIPFVEKFIPRMNEFATLLMMHGRKVELILYQTLKRLAETDRLSVARFFLYIMDGQGTPLYTSLVEWVMINYPSSQVAQLIVALASEKKAPKVSTAGLSAVTSGVVDFVQQARVHTLKKLVTSNSRVKISLELTKAVGYLLGCLDASPTLSAADQALLSLIHI